MWIIPLFKVVGAVKVAAQRSRSRKATLEALALCAGNVALEKAVRKAIAEAEIQVTRCAAYDETAISGTRWPS